VLNPQIQQWRFRREGDRDEGVVVSATEGLRWIEDGVLTAEDEVSPADRTQWCVLGDHPYWGQQISNPARAYAATEDEVDPDMTSMIDVVFQLIIFFMVAASLTESELKDEHVFVVLSTDGTVKVNDETIAPESYDTLLDVLKNAISEMDNSEMVLDAPDDVKHEYVIAVLDAAAGAEVNKVLLVARPDGGDATQ
jgi:biopolymer transport protein ExbD